MTDPIRDTPGRNFAQSVVVFPVRQLNGLRRRAASAARCSGKAPSGWSPLGEEPLKLLEAFPELRLRPGFTLRGYRFWDGGNGASVVYAMPVTESLPAVENCDADADHFLRPPVPAAALPDFMEAIEGGDTPWSYLSASIFARELRELGARWHGCNWSTHVVLGGDPSKGGRVEAISWFGGSGEITSDADAWTWEEPPPANWLPSVEVGQESVAVCFHTHSGLGQEAIYRHEDVYPRGSYRPRSTATAIAHGPAGFVF